MTSNTDKAEDIGEYHPYADMLLEDFYKKQLEDRDAVIADQKNDNEYLRDLIEDLRDSNWKAKQTVTNVTDARCQVIMELLSKDKPGAVLDSHRITSILRNVDDSELRLPDNKNNSEQVIRVIKRIPKLDDRFRIEQIKHAKKTWRVIRKY